MEYEPLWKIKVGLQPLVVVDVSEGTNHFTPMWDARSALGGISNHRSSLENKDIDPIFCEALGSSTSCRASTHDDDGAMFNLFDGQPITSCVTYFDEICDVQHHGFCFTLGKVVEGGLGPFKVRSNQNFSILHAV